MSHRAQRILWDVTRASRSGPETGIRRLSRRLRTTLLHPGGREVIEVNWDTKRGTFLDPKGNIPGSRDLLVTPELFSEEERPGLTHWVATRPCAALAFCHDLLPLRMPECVRPNAVRRAPSHLQLLSRFDAVAAISEDTAADLRNWWSFQSPPVKPPVHVVRPGADGLDLQRGVLSSPQRCHTLLMLGTVEPRKRQAWIATLAACLKGAPKASRLVIAGRVNDTHGKAELRAIRTAARSSEIRIDHVDTPTDARLLDLLAQTRALVFASTGEGAGLPIGEALWAGLPCLHTDLPVLNEWGAEGCVSLPADDVKAWSDALQRAWSDDTWIGSLAAQARTRPLQSWRDSADALVRLLDEVASSFQSKGAAAHG